MTKLQSLQIYMTFFPMEFEMCLVRIWTQVPFHSEEKLYH